ncbi:hypothetical protein JX265_010864 [Neoarthrinium moseri]|uniref:Nucleoprotein TPR/MLP1 domain-containing protein n=1 Tax=Neoarthrinium moseri TaxID=1658444 RepID=A0A9Q0AK83_9PEZI|nr:hypothetical protein JX265_010864 [Neoarthrinium moseri]
MAAADVDVGYLAAHLSVPEENLTTAITAPTAELVHAVLAAVAAKAHEFDDLYTQKVQLEVELETNVRGAEAQRDASNETARKALKDVEEIRQKLKHEETTRQALENEIRTIKSSSSTSESEIESLRARIASLETSNRESLAIIDNKNAANDSLSQELQAQHQKNLKLNQELTAAQQAAQNAQNVSNSAKIKESQLRQELDMARKNSDFWENEQKSKAAELLQVRKDRGAQISKLTSENTDLLSQKSSSDASLARVKNQLDETQAKLTQSFHDKQQAEELAASREEGLRQDLDSAKRLIALMEERSNSEKLRLAEVEARVEQVKRDGEDEVRRITTDLEHARQEYQQAQADTDNLRDEIARLEALLAGGGAAARGSPGQPGSAPQTPRPLNGSMMGRPGSPFATPGTSVRKSISATQALEEMYKYKGLLAAEKQRSDRLARDFDEMVDQLEAKGPEIDELQSENERLQHEIQNMSHLSDQSFQERDAAKKAARKAEADLKTAQVELNISRQQVRDLSAQLQMMVFALEHQGQELTLEEQLELQRLERATGFTTDDMTDVDSLIIERLVVFKDVRDLQEKNQELLKVVHELSEDMKNSEDPEAKRQAAEDHEEVSRLRATITEWEDRLRSLMVQHDGLVKQRDMFRRLAENRGASTRGPTGDGDDGVLVSIEENGDSVMGGDSADYATVLRELQQQYDSHRTEWNVDRDTMKKQIEALSTERNSLQSEKSKLSSQLGLKDSRFEMLESNFKAAKTEIEQLQNRIREQSDNLSKQDIRTQQAAEDLVEARSLAEGLRNENANLKAEKKLHMDVQARLSQDNESLLQEKSRLNGLLDTQQSLQNERDLSESETKRRLQGQIDTLEAELNSTKRQLTDQVEEGKKLQIRKEFDAQQSQKRIDELTANLSQIREDLVAARTSKDHLQKRVEELTIELRTAEERAERLQPRPTPRPGSMAAGGAQSGAQDADERYQEVVHEMTDLKRDLELAKTHLENAKAQADQYKEISQSSEEALQGLQSAQDEYMQMMDSTLAEKEAAIKESEQRIGDLSAELGRSNSELSSLRDSQDEVARRFQDEKAMLEDQIKRLKDQEENYTASSTFHQQDLRAQAEIASNAQQQYETEVVKHGETAKALASVRAEYNQLRTAAATLRAEAESAKATLLQNESSWEDRRRRFEQELADLRTRREDADKQSKILHGQLESMQAQVLELQRNRASTTESSEAMVAQPTSTDVNSLRELASYLRREKDILEGQHEMTVQEAKRLQQTLDYTQSQLDETRLKLEQERQAQNNTERSTTSHKELMEKLDQLNLFRESNAALRAEKRQIEAQLAEKTTKLAELEEKVQPLEAQIEELNSQLEHKQAEINQIRNDRDYWQKRSEDIIAKHGKTDPAEVEELKANVAALESERDTLQEAEQSLKTQVQELENAIGEKEAGWQASKERLVAQFKERSRNLTAQKNEAVSEKDRLQGELNDANTQLASTREELESEKAKIAAADEQLKDFQRQVQSLHEASQQEKPAVAQAPAPAPGPGTGDASNQEQISALEQQLTQVKAELEAISTQKATVDQELGGLREQLNTVSAERDRALASAQSSAPNGDVNMENGTGEAPAASAPLTDEERQTLEQRITEAEAKAAEFEKKAEELQSNQAAIINSRSDKMKAMLNDRLKAKNAEFEKERTQMQQTIEQQKNDFELRMEQERKIWEAEQKSGPAEVKPPSTPSQQTAPGTPTATPSVSTPSLDNLNDDDARKFVASNPTVKSIVTNNIKNKVEQATKKLKEEYEQTHVAKSEMEQKITQAKESATKMASSKASVQVNMAENRARTAQAKLGVVEAAAKETPEKPVGEVWELAKTAKPPPPPPKPAQAPASNGPAASAASGAAQATPASQVPKPAAGPGLPKPQVVSAPSAAQGTTTAAAPVNPFAQISQPAPSQPAAAAANPFASSTNSQPAQQTTQNQPAQTAAGGGAQPKSGIPAPSSKLRPPSGTYQAPRGGARGGRGGRGGAQAGGRQSLNAGAETFQPGTGNKRPRNDSEAGGGNGGPKRMRGGAGAGAAQQ